MVTSASGQSLDNAAMASSDGRNSDDMPGRGEVRSSRGSQGSQGSELRQRGNDTRKNSSYSQSDRSSSDSSKESVAMSMIQAVRCNVDMLMGGRSSIAMERLSASIDITRPSSEVFTNTHRQSLATQSSKLCEVFAAEADVMLQNLSPELRIKAQQLGILMKDTPAPIAVLQILWDCPDPSSAITIASQLEQQRILKSAILENASIWILVPWDTLRLLQAAAQDQLPNYHRKLMEKYAAQAGGILTAVPDDGYLYPTVSYHLASAGMLDELRTLLMAPLWLEIKTRYYGAAQVVEDFRRYLRIRPETDIKLLLQAFQMSESCCQNFPNIFMLGQQLLGRLLAVSQSPDLPRLRLWCQHQKEGYGAALGSTIRYLVPRTPTLSQAGGLLKMTLKGHTGAINALALSPDGLRLLTASADTTTKIWDMEIGDCTGTLDFHSGSVTCVKGVPNSNLAITGGEDGFVVVWDLEQGQYKSVLAGHKGRITAVEVDNTGSFVLSCSADSTCKIWNIHMGKCIHTLKGHGGACLHIAVVWDGAFVANNKVVTVADDFTGRVWDLSTGKCVHVLEGHSGWVVSVAGMSNSNRAITASHDGSARIWDVDSGECLKVLEGHAGRLNKVVLSHDENRVFTASDDYSAMMWSLAENEAVEFGGHEAWLSDIVLSRDSSIAVTGSGDHSALVWDIETGESIRNLKGHSAEVTAVALTAKGRFAITASADSTARVWDLQAAAVEVVDSHHSPISSLNIIPSTHNDTTTTIITTDENGGIFWWDAETGAVFRQIDGHDAPVRWAHLIENNTQIVTVSGDRWIRIWDVESGELLRESQIDGSSRLKSFAAAGKVAIAALFDSSVWLVSLEDMKIQQRIDKIHKGGVNEVGLDFNGEMGLTTSKDCTAQVFELCNWEKGERCSNGKFMQKINLQQLKGHSDSVSDGVVRSESVITCSFDKTVRIWGKVDGQFREIQMLEHKAGVNKVVLSPCSNYLVAILENKTAWLWDVNRGSCIANLKGHKNHIEGASFSQNSQYVCTYSEDCTVNVWTVSTGKLEAFYLADCRITVAQFLTRENGRVTIGLAAGDVNGLLHFMDLPHDVNF